MTRTRACEPARNRGTLRKNPGALVRQAERAGGSPRLERRRPSACLAVAGRRDTARRRATRFSTRSKDGLWRQAKQLLEALVIAREYGVAACDAIEREL